MATVSNASITPYVASSADTHMLLIKSWQNFASKLDDTRSKKSDTNIRGENACETHQLNCKTICNNGSVCGGGWWFVTAMQLLGPGSARKTSSCEDKSLRLPRKEDV